MARKTIKGLEEELEIQRSLKEECMNKVLELDEIIKDLAAGKVVSKFEYDKLLKKYEDSSRRNQKFMEILKSRSQSNKITKVHNERGAGRKSSLTDEQRQRVKELHQQGLSYGKIAKEVNLSKAYVYKLINKQ